MATEVNPQDALARFVRAYKTQRDAAAALSISQPYLCDMLKGKRDLSSGILSKLGLRRAVVKAAKQQEVA